MHLLRWIASSVDIPTTSASPEPLHERCAKITMRSGVARRSLQGEARAAAAAEAEAAAKSGDPAESPTGYD